MDISTQAPTQSAIDRSRYPPFAEQACSPTFSICWGTLVVFRSVLTSAQLYASKGSWARNEFDAFPCMRATLELYWPTSHWLLELGAAKGRTSNCFV